MVKVRHTKESDVLFLQFEEKKVAKTVHREPDIFVDLDKRNTPLSLEVVNLHDTPIRMLSRVIREFHLGPKLDSILLISKALRGSQAG